ncbi:hypothetical protein DFH09DRAFT_1313624 [Mycena vulgaris]|nr:hypothetical protein DFH09DRAFT_1349369 [Mycena vulgaris]KAJ6569831.1 hypothetical protein DFH09DRAFT_1313624 [Mycena vulgaris]
MDPDTLSVLTLLLETLPSKTMSISQLLRYDLPPRSDGVDAMDMDCDLFNMNTPTRNIEELLPFLALPPRPLLTRMAFPFWVLTYWAEMLEICESKDAWLRAESWMTRAAKTTEEKKMNLTVRNLWNVVGWHGHLNGFGNVPVVGLAALFSKKYLGSEIVDALLALLSFRLRLSEGHISESTLIVDTTFASVLELP